MITYQEFMAEFGAGGDGDIVQRVINEHMKSDLYLTAMDADLYDRQQNKTIMTYVQMLYEMSGQKVVDFTASNSKITSNFFRRLNTQRCSYSLGNGVLFQDDATKKKLGQRFDTDVKKAGYAALIHGLAFLFWNYDRVHAFRVTEFAPLWDEVSGALMTGIRFWQLDKNKPMIAMVHAMDGIYPFKTNTEFKMVKSGEKQGYKNKYVESKAEGKSIIGTSSYSSLPVVPLWGSELHQSTLIGMQRSIDSFDLVRSGFANDLSDCSQIYWLVENYGGMTDSDLAKFRDRMKIAHIASADTSQGGKITPYTQEVPYAARTEFMNSIRSGIYEDFGGLDVHVIAAGATNDHIDAAYQPLDENADDFEFELIEAIQQVCALAGIKEDDYTPMFKRNRISNEREQVETIMLEAPYLDNELIRNKLPNLTPDDIAALVEREEKADTARSVPKKRVPPVVDDLGNPIGQPTPPAPTPPPAPVKE